MIEPGLYEKLLTEALRAELGDPDELAAAITALIAAVASAKPDPVSAPKTLLTVPEAAERLRIGEPRSSR